jgi:hypothetical protein
MTVVSLVLDSLTAVCLFVDKENMIVVCQVPMENMTVVCPFMDSLIADLTVFRQKDDQFLKFKVNI